MNDLTEEEQVERLKAFWSQYGMSIVIGVVLGGAGLFGWYQWQDGQRSEAEAASAMFAEVADAADAADITILKSRHSALAETHPESPYVSQADLLLAALYMQRGETEEAQATLETLLARENGSVLEPLVATRLARVLIYRDQAGEALEVLERADADGYAAMFDEVRGDALVALTRYDEARAAYQAALDSAGQPQLVDANLLDMKLGALPEATAAVGDISE
ncbi:MAG: tetratricopeptide repeat protein [Pseudomonadota bacterium]